MGVDLIPNKDLWVSIGDHAKEGCIFTSEKLQAMRNGDDGGVAVPTSAGAGGKGGQYLKVATTSYKPAGGS